MAKAKKFQPKPVGMRCGCKVSWYYFKTKEEAVKMARLAKGEALELAGEGYDFGYLVPGTVTLCKDYEGDYAKYNGLWEVVIP